MPPAKGRQCLQVGLRPSLVRFERVLSIENFGPEPGAKTKLQRINFCGQGKRHQTDLAPKTFPLIYFKYH